MADFQPIETAPKDGTVIGGWSPREPGLIRLTRWGHHLNNPRYAAGWSSITRSIHLSNVPTHWIAVGPLPATDGVGAPSAEAQRAGNGGVER